MVRFEIYFPRRAHRTCWWTGDGLQGRRTQGGSEGLVPGGGETMVSFTEIAKTEGVTTDRKILGTRY